MYLLGLKIRGLVPFRVLKSKMTFVRGVVVPLSVLSRTAKRKQERMNLEEINVSPIDLVPLWGKKLFGPRPQNRILVPFRGSFQNFQRSLPSLLYHEPAL